MRAMTLANPQALNHCRRVRDAIRRFVETHPETLGVQIQEKTP
jgi:hypothetical protein